jgi:CheY-like chemotaxis protein
VVREFRPAPPVEGSEAHLTQVFMNLVLNALQSIPQGEADRHEIRILVAPGTGDDLIAEVQDTGAGMPPEVLARIFEPFFTTRPVGTGTGLGLAICHGIVTSLGGRIQAFSEAGKGSRFRVTLPAVKPSAPEPPRPPPPPVNRRGRVLLVEDDPLVARAVRRTLGNEHDVTFVEGGRAALAALAQAEFDVVLCDLMMPEMTGMELHAELSRDRPEIARRMVFLSGGAFTDTAREFLASVPNAQVEKPFEPSALRSLIRRLVG